MNTGSTVYQVYHGILRLGVITDKVRGPDDWTHFAVNWVQDDQYDKNVRPFLKEDKYLYRADEITPIDPARLSRVVSIFEDLV
jgi:hypothetical protein